MGSTLPAWPLFLFGGLLTFIAVCIFVGIFLNAREEERKTRDGK